MNIILSTKSYFAILLKKIMIANTLDYYDKFQRYKNKKKKHAIRTFLWNWWNSNIFEILICFLIAI